MPADAGTLPGTTTSGAGAKLQMEKTNNVQIIITTLIFII